MSKCISIEQAKIIMGDNFIGYEDLSGIDIIKFKSLQEIPSIPFSVEELKRKRKDYLLVLGLDKMIDGRLITIRNLLDIFGRDPDIMEPCFYNQDWYDKEDFIDVPMKKGWFLIRKNIYEDSRALQPNELIKTYIFPSAIYCTYAFFVSWLTKGVKLWYYDYVWCSDTDHNGDRIYVGKYHDIDGVNKNGFSIHRHLALRSCYGCID